jgi:hypothetical protein
MKRTTNRSAKKQTIITGRENLSALSGKLFFAHAKKELALAIPQAARILRAHRHGHERLSPLPLWASMGCKTHLHAILTALFHDINRLMGSMPQ